MSHLYSTPVASAPLRICIVTPDLLGPVRNGGIGTACTFLSEELAAAGHQVSVLFSQIGTLARAQDGWVANYRQKNISVEIVEEWQASQAVPQVCPAYPPLTMAHYVDMWLAEREFDLVILMEWQGHGFYALNAKRAGLRFQNTVFLTQLHSPSLWHALNNADLPSEPLASLGYFMERKSVELADMVVSPSAYMLDWVRNHGFRPPSHAHVLPNLIGSGHAKQLFAPERVEVSELVFFGRLEYRKGLVQFCDALDRLQGSKIKPSKVTFLGKFSRMGQEHSGLYIARRAKRWDFPVEIQGRMNQQQALAFLSQPGRLAIMPSVADNSPYTVYECLAAQIPFLARDVGGVAELIAPSGRDCLFDDNPGSLTRLIAEVLATGCKVARLAFDIDDNRRQWRDLIAQQIKPVRTDTPVKLPRVSVCLTHYNRIHLLHQAIASLLAQDYANFEVILVDDGSPGEINAAELDKLERDFARRNWRVLRLENGYLGKARNTAVRHAEGSYVLFMDDDNVARPNMISRFVQAAMTSGADLVTAVFDVFAGDQAPTERTPVVERFLPLGAIVSFSLLTNVIGDSNSLIKRSVFEELGGFTQDYGLGHEDFELYLRVALAGKEICVVPEPLFWYRRNGSSMLSDTHAAANRMRSFRPFAEALPAHLAEMAVLAHGVLHRESQSQASQELARPELSTADRNSLSWGDPDAPSSVAALAKYLILDGDTALANNLLDQLDHGLGEENKKELAYIRLLQRVSAALNTSDLAEIKDVAEACDSPELPPVVRASLYQTLLSSLESKENANELIVACATRLLENADDQLSLLTAARHFITADAYTPAVAALDRAITLADAEYLLKRPDVAGAINRQAFHSGLEHFLLHGKAEGGSWPHAEEFASIVQTLISAIRAGTSVSVPESAKQQFILALRTFNAA